MARFSLAEFFLFTLLFSQQSVFSLKCYVCNSGHNEGCNLSPPPKEYLVDCSLESSHPPNPHNKELTNVTGLTTDSSNRTVPVPAAVTGHQENATAEPEEVPGQHGHHPHGVSVKSKRSVAENKDEIQQPYVVPAITLDKDATFCRKIINHIPAQNNGPVSKLPAQIRTVRTCGYVKEIKSDEGEGTCKWIGTEGVQKEHCECFGDGCNSGNFLGSLKIQTLILLSVMAFGYVYIL